MNKATTMTKVEKRDHWAKHIKQWLASKKTQRDYCEQHQLKLHQLLYWLRVLEEQRKTKPRRSNDSAFVAVQLMQPTESPAQSLTIQLPSGIKINGIHGGNLELVQENIWRQS